MKYIDTQVVYDQYYEYTIYAYNLTIGSKYGFQIASHKPGFVTEKQSKFINSMGQSAFDEGYGISGDYAYYKVDPTFQSAIGLIADPGLEVLQNLEKLYTSLRPKVYGRKVNDILINNPDIAAYLSLKSPAQLQSENANLEEEIADYYHKCKMS